MPHADANTATGPATTLRRRQSPLRIALVTETYAPEVNGVALTLAPVVDGLRQRGHRVRMVRPQLAGYGGAHALREVADGDDTLWVRGSPIPCYPQLRFGWPAGRRLRALWQSERPDIVHVATEGPLGWSAVRVANRLRLPLSSDFRTHFAAYSTHYGARWLARPIDCWLTRLHNRTDATMVPTEDLRASLQRAGVQRLRVVGRGVDSQRFTPAARSASLRAAWGVAPADVVVAYVGRLAVEKNLPLLLTAFARLRELQARARLLLVGDGPLREALQQQLPDAIFAGLRHGAELAAHYASADLFLFPSLTETYGNVVPEAMASALPVVAFDVAAAGQLISHGVDGLLARPGDADGFATAAAQLAVQPERRRLLAHAARQRACTQTWDAIVDRFEDVLQAVIAARVDAAAPPSASATAWQRRRSPA